MTVCVPGKKEKAAFAATFLIMVEAVGLEPTSDKKIT